MAHGVAERGVGAVIQRDWESSECTSFNCRRTCHIFQQTGAVCKRKYPRGREFRKLTKPLELYVFHLVLSHPGIYLRELTANLLATTGVEVAESTICQFLHQVGFTRQKMKLVAKQVDESLRAQFIIDVSLLEPDMFIFVDETGADRRDTLRKYGYSLHGKPEITKAHF